MKKYGTDMGRILEIRIQKHPEGEDYPTPFSLVITAQHVHDLGARGGWPKGSAGTYDFEIGHKDLDVLRESIVLLLEEPSLRQLVLRLRESLDQLSRHVPSERDHP